MRLDSLFCLCYYLISSFEIILLHFAMFPVYISYFCTFLKSSPPHPSNKSGCPSVFRQVSAKMSSSFPSLECKQICRIDQWNWILMTARKPWNLSPMFPWNVFLFSFFCFGKRMLDGFEKDLKRIWEIVEYQWLDIYRHVDFLKGFCNQCESSIKLLPQTFIPTDG